MLLDALANLPSSFDSIGSRLDNAALLHRAGVSIAFTQFGESHNARKIRQLAGNAVAHGLPKDAALAALTARPAEIFGLGANAAALRAARSRIWCCGAAIRSKSRRSLSRCGSTGAPVEMRSRQSDLRDRYLQRLRLTELRVLRCAQNV